MRINSDAGTLTLGNINLGFANYLFGGAGNILVNGTISDGAAGTARFIQITNNGTVSRNLQLSEIEAFAAGVVPAAGFDPTNNVQLNTNPGAGYFASGPATIAHGTTASINDGVPAGGATSFNLNTGVGNFITMTLGQDRGIGRVRLWQRNDGCCQDRLSDFTVSLLANNAGVPGAVIATSLFAGQVTTNSFADINFVGNIVKDGSGTVTFGGANNYNGTTTINSGTLVAANNGALGAATARTTVNSGGALRVTGSGLAIPENVSISGTGVANGGAIVNTANANSLTGTISVPSSVGTGDVRINSDAGTLTIGNSVEIGSAKLFVGGAGNVALNGVTENHPARFIRITNNGGVARNLQLSEIEAFLIGVAPAAGFDPANNVQLNTNPGAGHLTSGPAGIAHGTTASLNDGVPAGGATSFNLNVAVGNFITMTLGQDRNVGRVRLWQRNDGCCQDRLMDFTVSLLDSNNTVVGSTNFPGQVPTNSFSDINFSYVAGSFVKDGSGTATLNGSNYSFAGTTTINGGTLLVNGTLPNNTTNPDVTVNNTGTLGGTGTVGGQTQVASGGKVDPGASPGVLATGDVTFTAGSIFAPEINGTVVGTGYDQLNVTGAVTLGNATLTPGGTFVPNGAVFNSFTVINNDLADPIVGTFNGLPQNAPVGLNGGALYVSYTGGTGNDVVLSTQILGGAGDDTLVMRRLNATTNEYSINGASFISISNTLPFAYNGGGGNDLVWIDTTNGDPIPTGDITLSSVEFVRIEKTGAATDSAVVTPASTTITGFGSIVHNGVFNVDVVNFTAVTLNTATANDSLTVVNGTTAGNTGTLPGGYAQTGLANVQVSGGGFTVGSRNVGTLTIDTVTGGGNGNDTVTITWASGAGVGNLSINTGTGTDSILFNGAVDVGATGTVTLTSGGSITSAGAANDVTAAAIVATAVTGIDIDTTVGSATISNTGAGNVTLDNVGALSLLGFNASNAATITATGALTDAASAITNVGGNVNLSATSITLGETGTDSVNFSSVTFNSAGAVVISENSALSIAGTNTAGSADLDSTAGISDAAATSVAVTGLLDVNGTSISLGSGTFNAGTLTFNSAGAVVVAEDSSLNIVGTNTAGSVDLDATSGITDATATSVVVIGLVDVNSTSISLGSGTFNAGTLTFNSAGAVAIAEDSAMDLVGTNTAGSADLDSTGALSDAGATSVVVTGLMDVSGTSISLGGGTLNAGTLTFNSAGAVVIGEDSSIDFVGVNTAASADLDANGGISDAGATSVNVTGLVDVNGGAITLGSGIFNSGTLTFVSTATVSITEDSDLNLVGANMATGAIALATTDSAASENISIPVAASLSGSNVTLNAGDDAVVAGGITSTSDVTINVDVGGAVDATGGAANITGPVSTPVANFTFVNGNVQDDSITITPSLATEFRVFGDLPMGTTTGDELHMNVTGMNATLSAPGTVGIYTGAGSGDWTFGTGQRPVRFGSIEELDAPGALFHLIYNNDVTQAANLVVMLGSGGTNLEIRSGSNAGPVLLALASASVQSLTVNGNNNAVAEQVTIDDVNGLPEFASTPTLSPDNAVVTGLPGVYFQGNLGTNTLAFNLVQASTSQIVGLGDGATGSPDANAEVSTANGAGDALNVFGSSLASILRTSTGPTPGALTVQAENGNDTLNVSAGGGNSTNIAATGYTTFNFDAVNTYSAVTVNGNGGNDSLTLVSLGGAANSTPVTLDGGVGNDVLGVGTGGSLAAVLAPVTLIGGADTDIANVDNSASTTPNSTTVRENQIDGITGRNGSADVSFSGTETLSVFTSSVNDTITINMDAAPGGSVVTATINGSAGNDQFVFASAADPTLANLNLQGGTGDDTFGTAPAGGIGSPPVGGEFVPTTGVQIVISGESSTSTSGPNPTGENDQLNLNISAFTTAEVVDAGSGQVISLGTMPQHDPFYFNGIEDLNLYDGNELTNTVVGDLYLRSTNDGANDNILLYKGYTSPNDVLIRFNNRLASTTPFLPTGRLVVFGRDGNDVITLNYTLGNFGAEFHGEGGNDYLTGSLSSDILVGGAGNDQLLASDGNDILWGDDEGLTWAERSGDNSVGSTDGNDHLEGAAGNDWIFGGGGNDTLNGMTGDDYVHGGFGNDNVSGGDGNDVLRGGDGIDSLTGGVGNDLLLAGTGDDFLSGSGDRDFVFAGSGSDNNLDINDNGEDVNVSESHSLEIDLANGAYDSRNTTTFLSPNDSSLLALLATWTGPGTFAARTSAMQSALLTGATNDNAFDYLTGNELTLDYSIVAAIQQYRASTGDTIDIVP